MTKQSGTNTNNLLAWLIWGWAFQLFAVMLLIRHFSALGVLGRMTHSLKDALRACSLAQVLTKPTPRLNSTQLNSTD